MRTRYLERNEKHMDPVKPYLRQENVAIALGCFTLVVALVAWNVGSNSLLYAAIAVFLVCLAVSYSMRLKKLKQTDKKIDLWSQLAKDTQPEHSHLVSQVTKKDPEEKATVKAENIEHEFFRAGDDLGPKSNAKTSKEKQVLCPKCSSSQVQAMKHGFSGWKAVGGALVVGPAGLLAGLHGSGKVKVACIACGHTWKAGT